MRAASLIAMMVTTVFPVDRPASPRPIPVTPRPAVTADLSPPVPGAMMAPRHRPRFAALRRHLMASDDAIGWAGIAAAGGLILYMAAGIMVAWVSGRL